MVQWFQLIWVYDISGLLQLYDAASTQAKEGGPVDLAQMPRPPTQQTAPEAPAAVAPAQPTKEPAAQVPEPPLTSKGNGLYIFLINSKHNHWLNGSHAQHNPIQSSCDSL